MINPIKRVYGFVDGLDINFEPTDLWDEWQCKLPPDLVDGQYVALLYAEHQNGNIGVWSGILYVADGISHLHIKEEKFQFILVAERQAKPVLRPQIEIILREECGYHGSKLSKKILHNR